jgi:hypothetical protein
VCTLPAGQPAHRHASMWGGVRCPPAGAQAHLRRALRTLLLQGGRVHDGCIGSAGSTASGSQSSGEHAGAPHGDGTGAGRACCSYCLAAVALPFLEEGCLHPSVLPSQ